MAPGLIRPTAGDVRVFGKQVTDRDALSRVGTLVDGGTFQAVLGQSALLCRAFRKADTQLF